MSTVITWIICAILGVTILSALVKGLWSAAKAIIIPIQIILFVVMLICVVRMLFTKENATKLYDGIEQSGISQNMENTVRSALKMKPAQSSEKVAENESVSVPSPAPASVPVAAASASAPAPAPVVPTPAPASAPESVVSTPAQIPASATKAEPEIKPDYSRLDKGKKSYSYALPFGAQVTVGFRNGTYRVMTESMGTLSSSEKKEIGKMVMTALSEYSGETVSRLDNSKVTIDVKYDSDANRTRVFVTVPPSAVE